MTLRSSSSSPKSERGESRQDLLNEDIAVKEAAAHADMVGDEDNRRSPSDRRAEDRRRSAKGLFELRARRDRVAADRRQIQRRGNSRFRLAFWRREDA